MCLYAFTSTEHVTFNNRRFRSRPAVSVSDLYDCIHFHAAYLTAAIDGTLHCAMTDSDTCITIGIVFDFSSFVIFSNHGFLTQEGVFFTLATTEHSATNRNLLSTFGNSLIAITRFRLLRTDIHEGITRNIGQITTAIDITSDIGTSYYSL